MRDIQYRDNDRPEDLLEELGYETQDIHYKKFSVYGAYFFGFLIASALAGFIIMYFMVPTKLSGGRMSSYIPKTEMPDSTPRLQTNITARTDIRSLRQKESAILDTNGVVDQAKGEYRISIDDAINILAQKGLPKTAAVPSNGQPRILYNGNLFISSDLASPGIDVRHAPPGGTFDDLKAPTGDDGSHFSPARSKPFLETPNPSSHDIAPLKGGAGG